MNCFGLFSNAISLTPFSSGFCTLTQNDMLCHTLHTSCHRLDICVSHVCFTVSTVALCHLSTSFYVGCGIVLLVMVFMVSISSVFLNVVNCFIILVIISSFIHLYLRTVLSIFFFFITSFICFYSEADYPFLEIFILLFYQLSILQS